jgi:heme-degrading monooxygenase HmoA
VCRDRQERRDVNENKERRPKLPIVVLINPFEVPEGQEQEFLKQWREAAEHLRHASGFVLTRLHQSLDPQAKFRFVNVAIAGRSISRWKKRSGKLLEERK